MEIRRVDAEDQIRDLANLAKMEYGNAEIANQDFLKWQYLKNPAGRAIVVTARDNDETLAGQYVVIPAFFRINGERVKGSLSVNTLTHPSYRGRGLFTQMAKKAYDTCDDDGLLLTLGYANLNSFPGFVRKLNFKHIGNGSIFIKPLRAADLLFGTSRMKAAPKYAHSTLAPPPVNDKESKHGPFFVSRIDFEKDAYSYDRMMESQKEPKVSMYKDAKFNQWRFFQTPTRVYQAFQARDESGIHATAITRQRRIRGIEFAIIVDVQIAEGSKGIEAGKTLFKHVSRLFRGNGCAAIGIMINRTGLIHEIVSRSGFFRVPPKLLPHNAPVVVRKNTTSDIQGLWNLDNWAFSFGDYDVF